MKTNRLPLFVTALSLTAFCSAMRAQQEPTDTPPPSTVISAPPAPLLSPVSPVQWSVLKSHGFDLRDDVFAGVKGLEARVDEQMNELAAKRASMVDNNVSTLNWDLAMQEMTIARTALKSAATDLLKAPRETWDQMKDRVGDAWTRTQDAYSKVRASTTN